MCRIILNLELLFIKLYQTDPPPPYHLFGFKAHKRLPSIYIDSGANSYGLMVNFRRIVGLFE